MNDGTGARWGLAFSEKTGVREREAEAIPVSPYEVAMKLRKEFILFQMTGKVVVTAEERQWWETRQGRLKFYLNPDAYVDHALRDWGVFCEDIINHSGRHTHQGGLAIFVTEGRGYSLINGQRVDWEAGDLLLLPLLPEGCDHEHFNFDPEQPCRWMAFCYRPQREEVADRITQQETSPLFTPQSSG